MTTTTSSLDLDASLEIFEIKPGTKFNVATLRALLPDTETILFFGKVYDLDARQMGSLLHKVLNSSLTKALFADGGAHSDSLQDYVLDLANFDPVLADAITNGEIAFDPEIPDSEVLAQVFADLEVTVANSIKEVAAKLEGVVSLLPSKQGQMVFKSMMTMNAKRPVLGDYKPAITHVRQAENLVILDDSGSVNSSTINAIVADVVALSYEANAHFALVSTTCRYWAPGSYGVDDLLAAAQYGGTQYETLTPLFDRDWGTVITIADYDSSYDAKRALAMCDGRIEQLLDISLVGRPTFLAECVGQLAADVRPILIGSSGYNVLV